MALCHLHYFSQALGMQTAADVILPDAVEPPYSVMFLLHGLSDDHTIWQRRTSIERYMEGLPVIVVMPNGGRGFYADAQAGFAYGRAIGEELPKLVRRTFQTKDGWAVGGLSMGGYGALRLGLKYPETFRSVVSHSGALGYGHAVPDWAEEPFRSETLRIIGEAPEGGENDLYRLAREADPRPAIRIDCGTEDFLLEQNRHFHSYLDSQAVPHEYEEFPGGHTWDYWDKHVQEAIAFHKGRLGWES